MCNAIALPRGDFANWCPVCVSSSFPGIFTLIHNCLMISAFYSYYNICKNNQLDEFYNTPELIQFLRQFPSSCKQVRIISPTAKTSAISFLYPAVRRTTRQLVRQRNHRQRDQPDRCRQLKPQQCTLLRANPSSKRSANTLNWELYCNDDEDDEKKDKKGDDKEEDDDDDINGDGHNVAPFPQT